jgi:hypothetical protein
MRRGRLKVNAICQQLRGTACMSTDILVLGFYTLCRVNQLTTFRKPLWVLSSMVWNQDLLVSFASARKHNYITRWFKYDRD